MNSSSSFLFLAKFAFFALPNTANSLGTGEASERQFARTHGLPPSPPGPFGQFIVRNSTSLILRLHRWKTAGCPIKAFRIQYRPENGSSSSSLVEEKSMPHRWTVLNKELNNAWTKEAALLQINHLHPNTIYNVQVQAKSDAGITEEEYIVRTLNRSEIFYDSDDDNNDLGHNEHNIFNPDETAYVYRQFALLLPVVASIFVLILLVIFMFACLRRQTVQFPAMQLDRFTLPINSNSKTIKDASFLTNQTVHEQLVLSEYQKLNCPSTLNTSSTLPLDNNCSYPDLCSNNSNVNNQLNTSTIKNYFNNHLTDVCDQMSQMNSGLLIGNNDNTYSKMCSTNTDSLYYSSPLRKSAGNLVDCCNMSNLNNLNNVNNLNNLNNLNLTGTMNNDSSMMTTNDEHHQTVDPLVGLVLKGVQSNHDYAEPYAKQRACLIDSQDMVLLPTGTTFCTNGHQSQQLDNSLNYGLKKATANQTCNKAQQLRMVRINNNCQSALAEQVQQTYATVKRKSTNQRTTGLTSAQSANFNLLNQTSLE